MSSRWGELVLGLWVLISPWLLGFSGIAVMKWSNVIVGILLAVDAGWQMMGERSTTK